MPRVQVVTDSTADIPADVAAELGIIVVPCLVHLGAETYRDGVDLSRQAFYASLVAAPPFPQTAPPPLGAFVEAYRQAAAHAEQVVAIHLAAKWSALYNVAQLAREMLPELLITLIDSQQVSFCVGMLAVAAARAAQEGKDAQAVAALVNDMLPRLRLWAVLRDLRYLHRSGRVGWVASFLGTVLQVNPVILVHQARVEPAARVRTRTRALAHMITLLESYGPPESLAVIHVNAREEAEQTACQLSERFAIPTPPLVEAGLILSAHAGPGAVGVACLSGRSQRRAIPA